MGSEGSGFGVAGGERGWEGVDDAGGLDGGLDDSP